MRFAALCAGKTTSIASRLLGRGSGTTLPGIVAERLDGSLLSRLSAEVSGSRIAITGTNGKTTTAKMLGDVMAGSGLRVIRNDSGSNLRGGVTSALVAAARLTGGVRGDAAVLEVDEAATATVLPSIDPDLLVVTNFSRDQLDRYGDVDTLTRLVGGTLANLPRTRVLINADDPQAVRIASQAAGPVRFFGIDSMDVHATIAAGDAPATPCPTCSAPVRAKRSVEGRAVGWECGSCGAKRPPLDFAARHVQLGRASATFELASEDGSSGLRIPMGGLHNVYDAIAAAAAASMSGVPVTATVDALARFAPAFGRTESMDVEGRDLVLLLAKNPAGAQQALSTALASREGGAVALVLNDNVADGADVSWIWDIDFEALPFGDCPLVVGGSRAEDLAMRLKYAGLAPRPSLVENDPAEAVRTVARMTPLHRTSYVVATYTAMLAIRNAFAGRDDRFSRLGIRIGEHARA
jgi:UDP-N-acetylmuramyl tripeptide synthase